MAATDEVAEAFSDLLLLLGLDEPDTLDACLSAYEAPASHIFGVPTPYLSRFLKQLKSQCPPESRSKIEAAFMKFVTKVRCLDCCCLQAHNCCSF